MASAKGGSMKDWQPIKTAPSDRKLIVYGTTWISDLPRTMIARFWPALGDGEPADWYEEADDFDSKVIPTHWMPLPGAPSDD